MIGKFPIMHTKKSLECVTSNRLFWLQFSNPVHRRISFSFSNGLLYISPKKKPIFGRHLRLFFRAQYVLRRLSAKNAVLMLARKKNC